MGEEGTTSSPSPRRNDDDDDNDDVQTTRVSPRRRPSIVARRGSRVEKMKDQEERGKVVVVHMLLWRRIHAWTRGMHPWRSRKVRGSTMCCESVYRPMGGNTLPMRVTALQLDLM